jgi:hypothetical protein
MDIKDLTGKRFGKWTVINITEERGSEGSIKWKCRCDCGKERLVSSRSLCRGDSTNCGCVRNEKAKKMCAEKKKDLSGKRFGKLTVIGDSGKRKHAQVVWHCRCDCGEKAYVTGANLKSGRTLSCGCLLSETIKKTLLEVQDKNLKEGTNLLCLNSNMYKNNTSGTKGVYLNKGKWQALIMFKNKRIYLGEYSDKNDAIKARKNAEEKYFNPMLEKYGRRLIEKGGEQA